MGPSRNSGRPTNRPRRSPSGPREILAGGDYGELVSVGDADALARAIERVLDTPTDAALLEERSTAFGANAAVDRYLRLLLSD